MGRSCEPYRRRCRAKRSQAHPQHLAALAQAGPVLDEPVHERPGWPSLAAGVGDRRGRGSCGGPVRRLPEGLGSAAVRGEATAEGCASSTLVRLVGGRGRPWTRRVVQSSAFSQLRPPPRPRSGSVGGMEWPNAPERGVWEGSLCRRAIRLGPAVRSPDPCGSVLEWVGAFPGPGFAIGALPWR